MAGKKNGTANGGKSDLEQGKKNQEKVAGEKIFSRKGKATSGEFCLRRNCWELVMCGETKAKEQGQS